MKKPPRIAVTDHAIVRYMERVLGLDIEPLRDAISEVAGPAVRTGAVAIVSGGFRYVIQDGVVITVMPRSSVPKHPRDEMAGKE